MDQGGIGMKEAIASRKRRIRHDEDNPSDDEGGMITGRTLTTTTSMTLPRVALDKIASSSGIQRWQVEITKRLFDEQCSIPFIARYRKEKTGGE